MATPNTPEDNSYEKLYGKKLNPERVAAMRFNLVKYIEMLIQMDKQHKTWLKEQTNKEKSGSTDP